MSRQPVGMPSVDQARREAPARGIAEVADRRTPWVEQRNYRVHQQAEFRWRNFLLLAIRCARELRA